VELMAFTDLLEREIVDRRLPETPA